MYFPSNIIQPTTQNVRGAGLVDSLWDPSKPGNWSLSSRRHRPGADGSVHRAGQSYAGHRRSELGELSELLHVRSVSMLTSCWPQPATSRPSAGDPKNLRKEDRRRSRTRRSISAPGLVDAPCSPFLLLAEILHGTLAARGTTKRDRSLLLRDLLATTI